MNKIKSTINQLTSKVITFSSQCGGLIMGRQGKTIQSIEEQSGAKIVLRDGMQHCKFMQLRFNDRKYVLTILKNSSCLPKNNNASNFVSFFQ